MTDAIVIGAGLFGATIARALMAEGRRVVVIDDDRPLSGSKPSGCLMKPSWFSGLGKDVYTPALELIDRIYGIRDLKFRAGIGVASKEVTVHWAPANSQNGLDILRAKVTKVLPGRVCFLREIDDGPLIGEVSAPLVVVAAGVWCRELMEVDDLTGKQGASFTWSREPGSFENFIRPWAPYKQVVAFQVASKVWVGDGTAIKPENWTQERFDKSLRRCSDAAERGGRLWEASVGIRPFSKVKPCLLEERAPGLWLATGGAKNGTVAAGWAAHKIVEATS